MARKPTSGRNRGGALQGLNKSDMARQYGDAQVLAWRLSDDKIVDVNTPNGIPLVNGFDADPRPLKSHYLGDAEAAARAAEAVAEQGSAPRD